MSVPASIINNSAPAEFAVAVTPSDSVNLETTARCLYVGSGGNVTLVLPRGNSVLFANVASGTFLPVNCTRVNATGTTATGIVALY